MKNAKYLLLLLCVPLLVTGCKKVPKLADGKEVIVEIGDKQYTAEEFFDAMKEDYGTSVLINMVDKYITEKELTDDIKAEAEEEAGALYDYYYAYSGSDWNKFLSNNGFLSDDEFKEYLNTMYQQELVLKKYVAENVVTEEDLNKHYEENIFGENTVRHILIIPEVTDEMTNDEKKEAENKALEEAKELIEQLKKSEKLEEDFTALAKEKSDDTESAKEGGLIENFTNESGLVKEFWEASLKLEVGKMTEEPVKTQFGYHIIYKVSQKEKPSLETVKEKVTDAVVSNLLSAENATYIYWAGLREKYNMNIHDDIIKDNYDATMKQLQD